MIQWLLDIFWIQVFSNKEWRDVYSPTIPGLSWSAALKKKQTNKKTKAELKLLTDINIMQDIEVDIKSWISII